MGLDTVELVIRFEDAFGIAIPDAVAEQLTTPRKVTDYVLAEVVVSGEATCLSQQAFYFLRKRFVPALKISRTDFTPNTRLESLIPLERRRQIWAGIRSELGPSALPDLARPTWLFSVISMVTGLTFVSALIYAWKDLRGGSNAFLFGLFAAIGVGYGCAVVTRPLKRDFRRDYERAGDLARYLSTHSPQVFKKGLRGWNRDQVAAVVREIIVDETGRRDFTEDSHFVDDMHLD